MPEKEICNLVFDGTFLALIMSKASSRPQKDEDLMITFTRMVGKDLIPKLNSIEDLHNKTVTLKIIIEE